jgi:hypothetical protein
MPRSDWYSDTDPPALEVFGECQRRMTASEKVNGMLGELSAINRPTPHVTVSWRQAVFYSS